MACPKPHGRSVALSAEPSDSGRRKPGSASRAASCLSVPVALQPETQLCKAAQVRRSRCSQQGRRWAEITWETQAQLEAGQQVEVKFKISKQENSPQLSFSLTSQRTPGQRVDFDVLPALGARGEVPGRGPAEGRAEEGRRQPQRLCEVCRWVYLPQPSCRWQQSASRKGGLGRFAHSPGVGSHSGPGFWSHQVHQRAAWLERGAAPPLAHAIT